MALLLNAGDTVSRSYSYTQPSPLHPSQPQGTGERTGNLWAGDVPQYRYAKDYKKYNPDNAVYIKAGTYTISSDGKLPNFQVFDDNHTQYSISEIMTFPNTYYSVWNELSISPISGAIHTATITILADCIITLTVIDNLGTYIMLNVGSTPLPYEPYGYKIPISSAGQTTPVYLGEVETTRKVRKYEFTGQENWDKGTYAFYRVMTGIAAYKPVLCTHYQYYEGASSGAPIDSISTGSGGGMAVWIKTQNHDDTTIEQWKAYLAQQYAAGTPVTVWYVLATPETAVVNEPLMKIGNYADTVSGISIPTITGADSFDVLTTLKPSEVELTYTGWHDASVKESDGSDWQ